MHDLELVAGWLATKGLHAPEWLTGDQETPAVTTSAKGTGTITIGKNKSVKGTVNHDSDAAQQLRKLSAITRVPQAAYLREALDELLKKYAAALRKAK